MKRIIPSAAFAIVMTLTQALPAYAADSKPPPVRHRHHPVETEKATPDKSAPGKSTGATIKAATPPPPSTAAEASKTAVGTSMKVMPP